MAPNSFDLGSPGPETAMAVKNNIFIDFGLISDQPETGMAVKKQHNLQISD